MSIYKDGIQLLLNTLHFHCKSRRLGKLIHGCGAGCILQRRQIRRVSDGSCVCRNRSAHARCCFYVMHFQLGNCVINDDTFFFSLLCILMPKIRTQLMRDSVFTNLCDHTGTRGQAGSDRRHRKRPCFREGGRPRCGERSGNKARSRPQLDHLRRQKSRQLEPLEQLLKNWPLCYRKKKTTA